MKIEIQPRDIAIMRFVYKFRVVTFGQIHQKFFEFRHESASRNRIKALVKNGLLNLNPIESKGVVLKCISLAEKAWPLIRETWPFEVQTPYFKSESPDHDFRLVNLSMRFEKLILFDDLVTENLLQSSEEFKSNPEFKDISNLQADGALKLKDFEGTEFLYSLEFESSKKSLDRYVKKLEGYYRAGGIDGVLYICSSQEILDVLARIDRQVCTTASSIVYLSLEKDVLESTGKLIFRTQNGVSIGLY